MESRALANLYFHAYFFYSCSSDEEREGEYIYEAR